VAHAERDAETTGVSSVKTIPTIIRVNQHIAIVSHARPTGPPSRASIKWVSTSVWSISTRSSAPVTSAVPRTKCLSLSQLLPNIWRQGIRITLEKP